MCCALGRFIAQAASALVLSAMMLLHLFLHLLIYHLLSAKGGPRDSTKSNEEQQRLDVTKPKDTNYIIKRIDRCPAVGYYFTRAPAPNSIDPGACYLCFCQADQTAVCWKRDNRRCNVESFHYHGVGKRHARMPQRKVNKDTRIRRSPGFADIFFRDATRDAFNINGEHECKPFESSFSDDCPPADWCTGCTVCDCDANGRWDCHLLSFCPDMKKRKGKGGNVPSRKIVKKKPITSTPSPKKTSLRSVKTQPLNTRVGNNRKSPERPKRIARKSVTTVKPKPKRQKKKTPLRFKKVTRKEDRKQPKIIKKNIATRKPIQLNGKKVGKYDANTTMLAQKVVKKVMAAVKQMVQKEFNNFTKLVQGGKPTRQGPNGAKNNKNKGKGKKMHRRMKRQTNTLVQNKMPNSMMLQVRLKRAIIPADTETSTVVAATTSMQEEKPIESTIAPEEQTLYPTKSNLLNSTAESFTYTPVASSMLDNKQYYKYFVATENAGPLESEQVTGVNIVDVFLTNKTEKYAGNIKDNAGITVRNEIKTTIVKKSIGSTSIAPINVTNGGIGLKNSSDKFKYLTDVHHEEKDSTFNKWRQLKVINEKETKPGRTSMDVVKLIVNKTDSVKGNKTTLSADDVGTTTLRANDVGREAVSKKYNIVKILSHYNCPFLNNVLFKNESNFTAPSGKTNDLQDVLAKLLREYNSTTKRPKKRRKFSVIKYLKKMFNKIFKRKNNSQSFRKNHIIESLCKNFGPCVVNIKDKPLLRSKLADLDHETTTILKTVNIIKGLLKLLHMPLHYKSLHSQDFFRSDIQRLNSILKGNYVNSSQEPLTSTQLIQVEYIKKNTQYFIESVGKFTTLLNQIVSILTTKDINNDTVGRKVVDPRLIKSDPFQTLKYLLQRYNLVQNNLMRKMSEVINELENNTHDKPKVSPAVSPDLNSSVAIEKFSRSIIENLRKLTHLAQTLNYSSRSKRETRDDDALQYLLMLMEFLLKQNRPLDATPVNDGIDLLIEAIKNAPDIKTVRKKVLDYTSSPGLTTTTMSMFKHHSTVQDPPSNNEPSYGAKLFSEDTAKLFEMAEEDKDSGDRFQFDRRAKEFPELIDITSDLPTINKIHFDALAKSINHVEDVVDTTSNPITVPESKGNIINSAVDNSNTSDEKVNQGTAEKEKNNGHGDVFIDTAGTGTNSDDNPESSNIDVGKNNNTANTFSVNAGNGNNFDDSAENGNIENVKNSMVNIFNYNTPVVNSYDDNGESEHTDLVKSKSNVNILSDNVETRNIFNSVPEIINTNESVTEATNNEAVTSRDSNLGEKTDAKNIEVAGEFDEEGPLVVSVIESDMPSTTTEFLQWRNPVKSKTKKVKMLDPDNIDKKTKLEWIVENFGSEDRNIEDFKNHDEKKETIDSKRTNIPFAKVVSHSDVKPTPVLKTDISSLSSEGTEETNKKKKKVNAEEVMLKKQMSLLNSLDYGTERGEFEQTDSKDGNVDERYSENFSAYFV